MITLQEAKNIQEEIDKLVKTLNVTMRSSTRYGLRFEALVHSLEVVDERHSVPVIDVITFVSPSNIVAFEQK